MAYQYTSATVTTGDTVWQAWLLIAVLIAILVGLVVGVWIARRHRVHLAGLTALNVELTWTE